MSRQQWRKIIRINLLAALLGVLPFLPGPGFLSPLINLIYSLAQVGSILGLLLIPFGLVLTVKQSRKRENMRILPVLLWTVPLVALVFSAWVSNHARNISRTIAMSNADKLIAAIESYRTINNKYPGDISALEPDFIESVPKPWILGISGYQYEKKAQTYNLTFSQNVIMGFNVEVVVYDPTEMHKAEGEWATLYETGKKHWKYYIYD